MARFVICGISLLAAIAITACGSSMISSRTSSAASSKIIVVLGSSTAVGTGATPITNGWVYLYTAYAQAIDPKINVVNLGVNGYGTYDILPTDSTHPDNRPSPDTAKNITAALAYSPAAIIINLPGNDVSYGYTFSETVANYQTIEAEASKKNVPLWVTTTRPANWTYNQRQLLMKIRDWTNEEFGTHAIDLWTTFANDDGTLNPAYAASDNFHFNNAGHALLYQRVVDAQILQAVGLAK